MKLHVFNIKISMISTARIAGEERIKEILKLDELPADIRPMLRQEVIPSEALAEMNRLKARAIRVLLLYAVHNPLGGWNIDPDHEGTLVSELSDLRDKFYYAKRHLLANLPDILATHLKDLRSACENAGYSATDLFIAAVQLAQPTREYLELQLTFEYLKPRIVEFHDEIEVEMLRRGVYGQVLHEVAMRAVEAGRAKAVKSRLRAIDEIVMKFRGLSYIEPKMMLIANSLENALSGISREMTEKEYPALHSMAVSHAMTLLADEERLALAVDNGDTLFPSTIQEDQDGDLLAQTHQETDTSVPGNNDDAAVIEDDASVEAASDDDPSDDDSADSADSDDSSDMPLPASSSNHAEPRTGTYDW